MSASAPGAPCARTTAPAATRGSTSRTTTPARARTAGARTASAGICDDQPAPVPGVRVLERPRPDPQGADLRADGHRRATTARTPRSTGGTSTPRPPTPGCAGATTTRRRAFPYDDLVAENAPARPDEPRVRAARHRRLRRRPLLGRRRSTTPRPRPTTSASRLRVRNAGPEAATLHVLPTLWFRNTLVVGRRRAEPQLGERRRARAVRRRASATSARMVLDAADGARPSRCSATTRPTPRGCAGVDGPGVPEGRDQRPRRRRRRDGEPRPRRARRRALLVPARRSRRARRARCGCGCAATGAGADRRPRLRRRCATRRRPRPTSSTPRSSPPAATDDEALVVRQAFAGMLWGKQFYHYDVDRWLDGDPAQPPPPPERRQRPQRRLAPPRRPRHHLDAGPVGVPVVRRLGPRLPHAWRWPTSTRRSPRSSCVLMCREWFLHPNGAAAGLRVGVRRRQPAGARLGGAAGVGIDGAATATSSSRMFHKLLMNFTWWVNRMDPEGDHLFAGGFLGLDNIGPIDRSHRCPAGVAPGAGRRHRLDGASTALTMLEIAAGPGRGGRPA